MRSKSLFGLWLWLRMHCQPSFSILWGQPGDAEEISPLCCDVTDVNDAAFIFFRLLFFFFFLDCFSANCNNAPLPIQSCLISLCAKQWIFIFHIRGACIKENLIGPNNVKYPSDMYQPWTCYIRSIMRRVTSVIDFQYPLPNTRPGEFSQLSLEAFANQSPALQALTPLIFAVHQHTALWYFYDGTAIEAPDANPTPFLSQRNWETSKHGARKCFTLYGVSYRVAKFHRNLWEWTGIYREFTKLKVGP